MDAWAEYASEFHGSSASPSSPSGALVAVSASALVAVAADPAVAATAQMPRTQFLRELYKLVKAELAGQATGHACFLLTRRIRY